MTKGATGPPLAWAVTEDNGVVPINLIGFHAYVTFWYANAVAPHKVAAASVDGANGVVQYDLDGTEAPVPGSLLFELTLGLAGSVDGSIQEWGEASGFVFKRKVLDSAS